MSWSFPPPPWPCASPRGLRGLPGVTASGNEFPDLALLVLAPLQSPCSALVGSNESPRPPDLLSWDSSRARSRELSPPFHRHDPRASTPTGHRCPASASEEPTSEVLFRPRGFAPPRRFPPLADSRACCIPQPVVGFAAFPTRRSGHGTVRRPPVQHRRRHPRDVISYPPKNSPRRQPHRVTAAVALLPFLRLQGLAPSSSPYLPPTIAGRHEACPPMGFVPLQGPSMPRDQPRRDISEHTAPPPCEGGHQAPTRLRSAPDESGSSRSCDPEEGAAIRTRRSRHQEDRDASIPITAPRAEARGASDWGRGSSSKRRVTDGSRVRSDIPPGVRGARPHTHRTRRGVCSRLAPPESVRSRSSRGPFHRPQESRLSCGRRRVPRRPSWGS